MNCRYCNDNVLGVYGSIVGNERVSVRKKQQRKTKSVIYIIVKFLNHVDFYEKKKKKGL